MNDEPKPYLFLQFDGVIHSGQFGDGRLAGIGLHPTEGIHELLSRAMARYTVVIYSERIKHGGPALPAIVAWMRHYNLPPFQYFWRVPAGELAARDAGELRELLGGDSCGD